MDENKKKKKTDETPQGKNVIQEKYPEDLQKRVDKLHERTRNQYVLYEAAKNDAGKMEIKPSDEDLLIYAVKMYEAFGTPHYDLQLFLMNQAAETFQERSLMTELKCDKAADLMNKVVAILNGIKPRDEIEGMLAIQMIGVHNLAMETLKRAMIRDQTFAGKEANVNHATKMLRTYVQQMDALKRYRTGGQQKMTVKHVHVNEGGQAIVGTVTQEGGRGNDKGRG